ncbi:MAG: prepilin-type N-terminal cleavage/methylation domain-containing protein [Planctomycetota bacterium]|jgi:prepilin-type N-terminal cleavage/methylation domain-containing protein
MINRYSKLKSEEKGFTLIELIIVIVILGIISSVAVPKFIGLSDDAKLSSARGAGGSISASITYLHTQWLVYGTPYAVDDVLNSVHIDGGSTVSNVGNVITFTSGGDDYVWNYTDQVNAASGFITEDSTSHFP